MDETTMTPETPTAETSPATAEPAPQTEPATQETTTPETGLPESFGEMSGEEQEQALVDMGLTDDDISTETASEEERQEPEPVQKEPEAFYTSEELGDTPLEAIDEARLPEGARSYLPIVKRNMAAAQQAINALQRQNAALMQQIQQAQGTQNPTQQAPAQQAAQKSGGGYKELAAEAARIAKEQLGLGADDELEIGYEPEHAAAFFRAMQDVTARQNQATQQAQAAQQAERDFGAYTAQLQARPDFKDFDAWVTERLARKGKSPEMLGEYLRMTGDYAKTQWVLGEWWRMYQEDRAQQAQQAQQKPKGPRPPALESTGGARGTVGTRFDGKKFGMMDNDAQERALMELGLAM